MKKQLLLLAASLALLLPCRAGEAVFQRDLNGYRGALDGMLKGSDEAARSANFWGGKELRIAGVPKGGEQSMALLRFDGIFGNGGIPDGARIVSARLELYKTGEPKDNGQYMQEESFNRFIFIHRMLTPFQAGEPDADSESYACFWYRSQGGEKVEYWGVNNELEEGPVRGVDFDPEPVQKIPLEPEQIDRWYSVDMTKVVLQWQEGQPNHGLYLVARGYWIGACFASGQHPDPELRPKLIIEYDR